MSTGELMATRIGAAYLRRKASTCSGSMYARSCMRKERSGARCGRITISATAVSEPDPALQPALSTRRQRAADAGVHPPATARAETVLLGRGGSDTSGSYLAAKLHARRLEIWTDVPGMFTANPRGGAETHGLLKSLDYDEAQEIASSGAKVLHPRCILPASMYSIPLSVHATQRPELAAPSSRPPAATAGRVKAVCSKKGITLISMDSSGCGTWSGSLPMRSRWFKEHGLSVDLVSTSETTVTGFVGPRREHPSMPARSRRW